MDSVVTKTYTPLSSIVGAQIKSCSGLLENKMQCWRAGDVLVVKQTVIPAHKAEDGADIAEVINKQEYQLCYRHSQLEQARDAEEKKLADAQPAEPKPV